jgi:CBS-domain-containing membrane protein
VLLYGAIEAPFAQPRAIFFGHAISASIGVSITKLFLHLSSDSFQENLWLAGALSCAAASTIMAITKTIHPPSGGTALIAATQVDIRALGWYYVPVVMLSSVLMIAVGLITNNIQRQYPMYWWTSAPLKPASQKERYERDGRTSLELRENSTTKVNDLEEGLEAVMITSQKVKVPEFIRLSYDQKAVLDELQTKIKEYYNIRDESE